MRGPYYQQLGWIDFNQQPVSRIIQAKESQNEDVIKIDLLNFFLN